jgi:hypothetical protein
VGSLDEEFDRARIRLQSRDKSVRVIADLNATVTVEFAPDRYGTHSAEELAHQLATMLRHWQTAEQVAFDAAVKRSTTSTTGEVTT